MITRQTILKAFSQDRRYCLQLSRELVDSLEDSQTNLLTKLEDIRERKFWMTKYPTTEEERGDIIYREKQLDSELIKVEKELAKARKQLDSFEFQCQ